MPVIPTYNKRITPNMSGGGARVSGNDPVGAALGQLGNSMSRFGLAMGEREQKQLEFDEKIRAQNILNQGQMQWSAKLQEYQQNWQPGQNFVPELDKEYDRWVRENLSTFKTQNVREMFNGRARGYGTALNNSGNNYQTQQHQQIDLNTLHDLSRQTAANIYTDPNSYDVNMADFIESLELNQTLTPAQKLELYNNTVNQNAFAYNSAQIEGSPGHFAQRYGRGMARALGTNYEPQGANYAISAEDQKRLENFSFDPAIDAKLQEAAGGDQWLYDYLKTALTIENLGFGRIRADAVNNQNSNGTSDHGAFQMNSDNLAAYGLSAEDALDFDKALPAMVRYAQDVKDQYGGNFDAAIAHYNGGGRAGQAVINGQEPFNSRYLNLSRAINSHRGQARQAEQFELPDHWDDMTFQQQRSLFNQMRDAQRATSAELNNTIKTAYDQSMAALLDGKPVNPEIAPYVSQDMLRLAYGDFEGDRKFQALMHRDMAREARGGLHGMTRAELEAVQLGESPSSFTYKEDQATIEAVHTASRDLLSAYKSDPVTYMLTNNSSVNRMTQERGALQDAYNNAVKSGDGQAITQSAQALAQATQAADAVLYEEQSRFEGTALHFGQARFLTSQESAQLASTLNNAGPDEVIATLNQLEQMHGPYFSQVFGEAFQNSRVNYGYMVISTAQPQHYRDLVYAARRNPADMKRLPIQSNDPTDLTRRIEDYAKDIFPAIDPLNMLRPDAERAYLDVMTNLAFDYASKGASNADAAKRAYDMVTGQYVISGTLMIPREIVERRQNARLWDSWSASNVNSNVSRYARNYINSNLEDIYVMDSDSTLYGARTSEMLRSKLNDLSFYSTPDDSGVMVFVNDVNGNVYPLRGRDGQQLVFSWGDVFGDTPTVESDMEIQEIGNRSLENAQRIREEENYAGYDY